MRKFHNLSYEIEVDSTYNHTSKSLKIQGKITYNHIGTIIENTIRNQYLKKHLNQRYKCSISDIYIQKKKELQLRNL